MAIYFRFTSERDFSSIPLADPFISVPDLKRRIFESKFKAKKTDSRNPNGICMGTDMDLKVINAQSDLHFADGDDALIPNGTFVLLKRVPGDRLRRLINTAPIVLGQPWVVEEEEKEEEGLTSSSAAVNDVDFHDFGEHVLAVETASAAAGSSSSNKSKTDAVAVVAMSMSREEEDARIRALVNTPQLDWGHHFQYNGIGSHRGGGLVRTRVPPVGYVCHRCKVPGHFIQDCPTNGDPGYDFKRTKRPIGIPRSRLVAHPDGSYKLPDGGTAVLTPDEEAFNREMEGISSSSSSSSSDEVAKKLRTTGATDVSDITQTTVSQKNELLPEDVKQETSELVERGKKERKRSRTTEATDVSDITQTTVSQKNELLPEDKKQETSELVEPGKKKRKRSSKENYAANGMPVAPWYPAPYAIYMPYMPFGFNMQYLGSQSCILPVPQSYNGWQ